MRDIPLPDGSAVAADELRMRAVCSSGPGGQNVNKVATKVELRWAVMESAAISADVKARLRGLASSHFTQRGELVLVGDRFRSQLQNLRDVRVRLIDLLRRAWAPPRPRKRTRPSVAADRRRLADKRRHGGRKQERARRDFD